MQVPLSDNLENRTESALKKIASKQAVNCRNAIFSNILLKLGSMKTGL